MMWPSEGHIEPPHWQPSSNCPRSIEHTPSNHTILICSLRSKMLPVPLAFALKSQLNSTFPNSSNDIGLIVSLQPNACCKTSHPSYFVQQPGLDTSPYGGALLVFINPQAMDVLLQLRSIAGLFALAFLCSLWIGRVASSRKAKGNEPPEPSGALPILGHLHRLRDPRPLAHTFGSMADTYGPVFMIRLGMHRTLIVNSCEAAKECLMTNDKVLATRPSNAAGKHLGYDYSMVGFAPYGPYWRSVRKIANSELLSNARIDMFKHARSVEIDACVKDLYGKWVNNSRTPTTVEMKQWLGDLACNVVVNIVAGKRYFGSGGGSDEAKRFRNGISELFRLLGVFVPSDMFPFLKWMDLGGHESAMKSAARELDSVMTGLLDEHRGKKVSGCKAGDDRDFMDVMLSVMEDPEFSNWDTDKVIKANSLALILGGTDTTTVSMIWTLAALLNNRQALKRAQEELDAHVGRDRVVDESDIKNLVYLQAAVKEAFRLYPPSQFLVPHEAMEDCRIGGFHVPAGTRVLVNVWKLQRDPGVWPDPCEFRPERFLTSHAGVDVRGRHFELIPFGAGRRACPGISFSLQVIHLALARLIQGFELETPGQLPVEMDDGLGVTAADSTPLHVVITPRLPDRLYEQCP